MHGEKNVCESLLGTLLNIDQKTKNHGHARADLKKIGVRPESWLDDVVNGMKLPISCITLSKIVLIVVEIRNIIPINIWEAIMNF
jgi:hypothetical protein